MGHHTPPLSCMIVCGDEEKKIGGCLESVKWCDEIVVVDSYSRDRTVDICRRYTDRVYQRQWMGFAEQKRFALGLTVHDWVFNIDADERVSEELRREIPETLHRWGNVVDGFSVPRLTHYLGRWWRRGGWYPNYQLRLFRKSRVLWWGGDPHERVRLAGKIQRLKGHLLHFSYDDIADHLKTVNAFTDVAARELALRGRSFRVRDLLLRPGWRFLRWYALQRGAAEGFPGLFVALTASFYVFLKYAKLWEMAQSQEDGTGDP